MKPDPKQPNRGTQPEEGTNQDLSLVNGDASLVNQDSRQPDTTSVSDRPDTAVNDSLTQTALKDGEMAPEYGDAADPTFEAM